ncbi:glycoside hydrolase family 88 protein [Bacteroides sp. GD17]|jgi:rhamnogalacturonyl hydrolase YesR|uniref:glycoside hydrolase family 88 protein n=1 Tax=Bacteroides sp. GD17 TaxID=3139826 RepID=UPI0025D621B5|nr:glycoside hydrolase family 88 protein [uncultured Bacteroides sp.]
MKKLLGLTVLFIFFVLCPITAKITLPAIFSDNMVLQQNTQVNVWGKAAPGEKITVKASWTDKVVTVKAGANGKWTVKLKTPAAAKNQSVTVNGENSITINNVLIGEVWLCTGQSNMEFPVCKHPDMKWMTGMETEEEEMKDADYPEFRLFHVEHQLAPDGEMDDCQGKWLVCNPKNLYDFSAVGFVFGRKLHKELNVPVGMIQSTWGGTHAESWTKMDVMKNNPLYADVLEEFALKNVKQQKGYCKVPATLWNGMIKPILGYTVKGNIWYQGESNAIRAEKYQQVFTNMINSWRKEWKQPDMPFYFMQIAPHKGQPAAIREAQLKTWQSGLKNVGMAVITDAGDSTDIHPRNKRVAGERLALWALAGQYGKKVVCSGPLFKTMKVEGDKAVLSFDYAEDGLMTPNNEPVKGFLIAGADRRFYPATAVIRGSRLEVSAPQVEVPVAVRYAFCNFFRVNLYNKAGLPAVPFRSDAWEPGSYARWFADSEMRRFPQAYQLDHGKRLFFGYAQGVGCCAMLQVWKATGDHRYYDYVKQWADSLINEQGEIHLYDMAAYNLDFINSGKVLFDLYRETGDERYKKAMDVLIRQLKNQPRTLEGGFWHKLVYQHQMWLDGLYMASPFLAQYGAEFNKPEWIDEAVKQFRLCHKHTYDAKTGLYHHAWDESKSQRWADPETGHSPNFWGRSIGWWFMALVDALDFIPEDHPGRADMIGYIKGLAEALPKYQRGGLWYQVIDQPKRKGNFPEASVTTQCMYAYAKAVNKGYIDAKYRTVAEKALQGLKDKLLVENQDGTLTLTRCCQVGGLGGHPYRDGSFEYYIGEKMRDNDAKATGPFIMGCLELEK